ncbi:lasso peptide biosynthesis PqqD family chaperone [Sphingorhabdus sp. YGSMI21]|uniref:lasso peptide biosynthesis PqqD family chaperone n=1 Tax=Sphingorhabdus sp. YGSMI21 TaxID=2077182 RepID=UPI000C1DD369|nr:lasso peptide biosynthesis PqqD family chaperone [Sphingorhabdus sp. YGSMI21]ATW02492.1 PqqD family protein [Sphingorhabdus sp. YGSMI21]
MSELKLDSIVRRNPEMVSADMDGEMVMMSIEDSAYYGLNAVGSNLWEAMEEPVSVTALCDHVTRNFDIDLATCQSDVMELLTDLRERNLVQLAG